MPDSRNADKSLAGVRVLVGRARKQAAALSELLRQRGASVIEIPFIEIRSPQPSARARLDIALENLASYDWLILTSVNGVEALCARIRKLGIAVSKLTSLRVAAIGPATKAALEQRGVRVEVMPEKYVAEAVVEALRTQVAGKRVLIVRALIARDVIPVELRKAGATVETLAVYETVLPAGSRVRLKKLLRSADRRPHWITFTSSSTARNFMELASGLPLRGIGLASIGPVTSATLRELGLAVDVEARECTMAGVAEAIAKVHARV